jgi:hypothetical protein
MLVVGNASRRGFRAGMAAASGIMLGGVWYMALWASGSSACNAVPVHGREGRRALLAWRVSLLGEADGRRSPRRMKMVARLNPKLRRRRRRCPSSRHRDARCSSGLIDRLRAVA